MITRDRMAAVDRNAEALGIPRRQLMESSGNAIARTVREMADPGASIAIVAGRGNNGGDAFVAARFLDEYEVTVQLLGRTDAISTHIARANWDALQAADYQLAEVRDSANLSLPECDIIVDAIVGTGVTGSLREPAATAARLINDHEASVLAVDVPSGLDADEGRTADLIVEADHVVTFHDEKPGLADLDVPITVADIGIPATAELFVERGDLASLDRDPDSHKGDAGRIVIVGGGPYTGAPALTAQASLRMGADLSVVLCPETIADRIQGYSPDLIVRELPGRIITPDVVETLFEAADPADCVVIGPGMGDTEESMRAVREFLRSFEGRCVVDADALAVVPAIDTDAEVICTPHQGELVKMGGPQADAWPQRLDATRSFAEEIGHTLLVKGKEDLITDGTRARVSRTGNPGMTVGGTGDVLAGAVASVFAQKRDPVSAAAIAAYVTGAAGDRVATDRGHGLIASDVIDAIPTVLVEETP